METNKKTLNDPPITFILDYYNLFLGQEFEIKCMTDSPYHFNDIGTLCNKNNEARDEMLSVLLLEPHRIEPVRKMYDYRQNIAVKVE